MTLLDYSLALGMNGEFGLSGLKDTPMELENISIDVELQVRNLSQGSGLKELNGVHDLLLRGMLVHDGQIGALRMPEQSQVS